MKPYYCGKGNQLSSQLTIINQNELKLSSEICGNPIPIISWKFPYGPFQESFTLKNKTGDKGVLHEMTVPRVDIKECGKSVTFEANNSIAIINETVIVIVTG